jgi:hypothetical protein
MEIQSDHKWPDCTWFPLKLSVKVVDHRGGNQPLTSTFCLRTSTKEELQLTPIITLWAICHPLWRFAFSGGQGLVVVESQPCGAGTTLVPFIDSKELASCNNKRGDNVV